jgi:hypothetical protein
MELLVHQLGGSTLRTSGAWAATVRVSHRFTQKTRIKILNMDLICVIRVIGD